MDEDVGIEGGELIELAQQRLRVLSLVACEEQLGGVGKRVRGPFLLADCAGGGDELVGVGSFVRRATFREQAQLVAAPSGERFVASCLDPVGGRSELCERLLGASELRQEAQAGGAHLQRELGDAAPLTELDRFAADGECGRWPSIEPTGGGEIPVDDGGLASQALLERELERTAHVRDPVRIPQGGAGEAAPVESECRLGQAELLGQRASPLGCRDRLREVVGQRVPPGYVGVGRDELRPGRLRLEQLDSPRRAPQRLAHPRAGGARGRDG